jgi:hypothetical protein
MVTISNLQIYDYPNNIAGDSTPIFSWTQTGSSTLYDLHISYNVNSFSPPTFQVNNIPATGIFQFLLYPEFSLLKEGTYYAHMRGYDGSWGSYSPTLTFQVTLFPPLPPTINPVTSPSNSFTQTISGTKPANLYVYIKNNGAEFLEATYPNGVSGNTWSYVLPLVSGNNNISVTTSATETTIGSMSREVYTNIFLASLTPTPYNVWNAFDELGLVLSLQRNPAEKNYAYKKRLLDVYKNPGNSTYQGLVNGISRELGVSHSSISIERLADLLDPTYPGNLLNKDGNAIGTPLVAYAEEAYLSNPVFLGTVICDQSYWDGVNQSTNGYIYLPHIWDASAAGVPSNWQAGGIGDQDDLWVSGPVEVWDSSINDYHWYAQIHTGYFYSANPSGII